MQVRGVPNPNPNPNPTPTPTPNPNQVRGVPVTTYLKEAYADRIPEFKVKDTRTHTFTYLLSDLLLTHDYLYELTY